MPKERSQRPPNPSPESDQPPVEAGSSPGSGRVSRSDPGAGFVADAGPQFDPEASGAEMPAPPTEAEQAVEMLEAWEEEVIASLLGVKGRLLHAAAGVSEEDWLYTDLDLQAIAPPLTRICNRYEPVRRYARFADPITLLTAFSAYATRSLLERSEELRARAAEEEGGTVPIAPAGGPPPPPAAPAPATPPRQASKFPTAAPGAPPPPMQPSEGPAPTRQPAPAEAPIDPTDVTWETPSG